MCGIVCGESFNPSLGERVVQGLAALAHRGPDGSGVARIGPVFMGHARLAIVGGSEGVQPLWSEDRSVSACVNGEFYGHDEIAKQLRKRGHVLGSESDSEILIHLYQEMGTSCLSKLHGEFAFALYDSVKKLWFCARDRMGAKPLCFWSEPGSFVCASEAKALFAMGIPARLDRQALWHAQHMQYLPLGSTFFEGVKMLPPASMMLVSAGKCEVCKYWELGEGGSSTMSFEQACDESARLLKKAVLSRIPDAGIPWACHLSGGLDSSAVAAICAEAGYKVDCFTVAFPDDGLYDETPFARETAQFIGTKLHVVEARYANMFQEIDQATWHAEALSINGHLGAKRLLNHALSKAGVKVALTGEGADEIFMGYAHLKQDMLSDGALGAMEKAYLAGVQLPNGPTMDLEPIRSLLGFVPTWIAAKSSMAKKFEPMWHEGFMFESNPGAEMLKEAGITRPATSKPKSSSELWMKYCLAGYILKTLDDAQSMAFGIEGRLPFLDTELMEFAWSLPDEMLFHGGVEKGLLRRALAPMLPPSVVAKTKQSFMSPPMQRAMERPELRKEAMDRILGSSRLRDARVYDNAKVESFLNDLSAAQSPSYEPILMSLLTLSSLCEAFKL